MTHNAILRKISFVLIFLTGFGAGVAGLWLMIHNNIQFRYWLLELPGANEPQARIESFVKAITREDSLSAMKVWEVYDTSPDGSQAAMVKRREKVISELIATGIDPEYMVLSIQWWSTCCEPSAICSAQDAGGARINVQFMNKAGEPLSYIFDIFTRDQPYWGGAEGYPPREWVIRDVYPYQEKPLFWTLIYEAETRTISP